jgi:hypothetical protein
MLQYLTYTVVKLWSSWDLCASLQETSGAAETSAQLCGILQEQLRPLGSCARLGAVCSLQELLGININGLNLSYSSLSH